jgi:hypothetical protein
MPGKMARSGSQTPLGREPSTLSHLGFPTNSENGYHPRQFRVHLGNPGSIAGKGRWARRVRAMSLAPRFPTIQNIATIDGNSGFIRGIPIGLTASGAAQ